LDRSLNDLKFSKGRLEIVAGHLFVNTSKSPACGVFENKEQLLKDIPGVEVVVLTATPAH
jgi:hypothetical protein